MKFQQSSSGGGSFQAFSILALIMSATNLASILVSNVNNNVNNQQNNNNLNNINVQVSLDSLIGELQIELVQLKKIF